MLKQDKDVTREENYQTTIFYEHSCKYSTNVSKPNSHYVKESYTTSNWNLSEVCKIGLSFVNQVTVIHYIERIKFYDCWTCLVPRLL